MKCGSELFWSPPLVLVPRVHYLIEKSIFFIGLKIFTKFKKKKFTQLRSCVFTVELDDLDYCSTWSIYVIVQSIN